VWAFVRISFEYMQIVILAVLIVSFPVLSVDNAFVGSGHGLEPELHYIGGRTKSIHDVRLAFHVFLARSTID